MSRHTDVVVAVLTYRRPDELATTLAPLVEQATALDGDALVLVIDNDPEGSAEDVVRSWSHRGVEYVHEPRPGISAARNRALDEAVAMGARLLAFIDDDERPSDHWLRQLVDVQARTGAGAVVGAMVFEFVGEPDPWVAAGRFFERPRHATGTTVPAAGTGNLLLDLAVVEAAGLRFDEKFSMTGGSDTLFTRQLRATGHELVWCDEAEAVDRVPAGRATRRWVLLRATRSGNSWGRTSLRLARSRIESARVRLQLTSGGLVRVAAGLGRAALGLLGRRAFHQARGLRTAARGVGMLMAGFGITYVEYRRRAE